MFYPFMLYNESVDLKPIFKGLQGDPFVADLSWKSQLVKEAPVRDQIGFQQVLEKTMAPDYSWGFSPYLERRDTLLADCPQMAAEKRYFHLGMDIIVPVGTALYAPLDSVVEVSGYEAGEGNYGAYVLLRHEGQGFKPFFSLYGHLEKESLPVIGQILKAGETFAKIGDFEENGNWFHHTHLQVITEKGLKEGYLSKGYCTKDDLDVMNDLCPSPVPLFRV